MRCYVGTEEIWPAMSITEIGTKSKSLGEHDVPPKLINAVQLAEVELEKAQREVMKHLIKTGQDFPYNLMKTLHLEDYAREHGRYED